MQKDIKRIAVFCSGGDAPGMNAAIRAIVRTGSYHGLHVFGVYRGYEGMIEGDIHRLEKGNVANIIHRGGTILKTARCKRFYSAEGRTAAYESLQALDIDAVIAIGGDGTFTGAELIADEHNLQIVGVPGTIDNDLYGTDYTIGFDTAVNTAISAVDRIRDTADSHNRLFFVEVMGRTTGYIALNTGIGSGAGGILIPESKTDLDLMLSHLRKMAKRQKLFGLIIVAEGNENGSAQELANYVSKHFSEYETKVTIIGHLQRGGSPSALDRLLASQMGYYAVEALLDGKTKVMIGIEKNTIQYVPFKEAITFKKEIDMNLVKIAEILAL